MKPNYKESDVYKRLNFLMESPTLSGDEEVVARAGQGIEDPWLKEDQNPGIYGLHPLDEKGNVTPQYRRLLTTLHMVDLKPTPTPKPSEMIEKLNHEWRTIQERKQQSKALAEERIHKQWVVADNNKLKDLEKLKEEKKLIKQIEQVVNSKTKNKKTHKHSK